MEADVNAVSSRKVALLVRALGCDTGISKSEVSRICSQMDGERAASGTVISPPSTATCTSTSTPPT